MIPRPGFRIHLHKGLTLAAVLLMFSFQIPTAPIPTASAVRPSMFRP